VTFFFPCFTTEPRGPACDGRKGKKIGGKMSWKGFQKGVVRARVAVELLYEVQEEY